MARGMKCRSVLLGVLLAAALAAAPGPAAGAGPAAVEEYVLTLPGVDRVGSRGPNPITLRGRDAGPVGVVGEQEPPQPLLGSIASAVASPVGLALVASLAAGIWLATRAPGRGR